MEARMKWDRLISAKRMERPDKERSATVPMPEDERTPFEQDYDRVVFSLPFRRLARKTQVHPLAANDHIHNRLTHSIEVASVGRSYGRKLSLFLRDRNELDPEHQDHLAWIMQSACLIHDIGNPPFGHAGEYVIRSWTKKNKSLIFPNDDTYPVEQGMKDDWLNFEGNAQGFRLAARYDNPAAGYMRLTYATLAAAIKYPWDSSDMRFKNKGKHNIYSTESEIFNDIVDELGLRDATGIACRHPLSFLTEAADDICYRVLDLEDAVAIGICQEKEVDKVFKLLPSLSDLDVPLSQLRGLAIKQLLDACWKVFVNDYDQIMRGERMNDLKTDIGSEYGKFFAEVDDTYERIFGHKFKIATEVGAYKLLDRVLRPVLEAAKAIVAADEYKKIDFLQRRCAELIWTQPYVEKNLGQDYQWWLGQVKDFVGGMTDNYAMKLSCDIDGIMVGNM